MVQRAELLVGTWEVADVCCWGSHCHLVPQFPHMGDRINTANCSEQTLGICSEHMLMERQGKLFLHDLDVTVREVFVKT